jgi:hypothetical protein
MWEPRRLTILWSFTACYGIALLLFWDVTPCSLVDRYQHIGGTCCLHLHVRRVTLVPWRWRHRVCPKRWYLSTKLHGVALQNTLFITFAAVRILNITSYRLPHSNIDGPWNWYNIVNLLGSEIHRSIIIIKTHFHPHQNTPFLHYKNKPVNVVQEIVAASFSEHTEHNIWQKCRVSSC